PAFPGAEGFGADEITGGRGGKIVKITNLNDTGQGSFRAAVVGDNDPKIIIFEVSGIIRIKSGLRVGDNTTIAGQTAPLGGGITFYGWNRDPSVNNGLPYNDRALGNEIAQNGSFSIGNNSIIRHIRVRGTSFKGDVIGGSPVNAIFDHVSCSWGGDEAISLWGPGGSNTVKNIIIQWCTCEESVGYWHGEGGHNYGPMLSSGGKSYSIHHTLMAHHLKRDPEIQQDLDSYSDVRNCVQYDCGGVTAVISMQGPWCGKFNVINNYMIKGPSNESNPMNVFVGFGKNDSAAGLMPELYVAGNYNSTKPTAAKNAPQTDLVKVWAHESDGTAATPTLVSDEFKVVTITTHTAEEAYDLVIEKAGAFPRDSTTRRTIEEVINATGGHVMMDTNTMLESQKEWSEVKSFPNGRFKRLYKDDPNDWPDLPAPLDSDNDGMPDAWETANGLNPADASDAGNTDLSNQFTGMDGYTNIEVYINALADTLVTIPWVPASVLKLQKYVDNGLSLASYPNPFSSKVSISLNRRLEQDGKNITISIFNVQGNLVRIFSVQNSHPGTEITWDGKDNFGRNPGAGTYFYRIKSGGKFISKAKFLKTR
ncbi:MAG: T9SS type A sorting domain-containing protein, partial [bacterium]